MSYILGALSKADKERKGGASEDPKGWDNKAWDALEGKSGLNLGAKIAAGLVILLLAAIFLLLWILMGNLSSDSPESYIDDSKPNSEQIEASRFSVSQDTDQKNVEIDTAPMQINSASEFEVSADIQQDEVASSAPNIPIITGHLHFPTNESLSKIFTASGAFRIGYVFEDGLKLVAISKKKAVFDWQGESYEVSLGN